MGALTLTQAKFDDIVLGIADRQTELAQKAIRMRRQGDTNVFEVENHLMVVQNIIDTLRDYDIEWEILTEEEVYKMQEVATVAIEQCPM
jgi:hypothetical protein